MFYSNNYNTALSPQGDIILNYDIYTSNIKSWSVCLNGTFFENRQCLSCSSSCVTCYKNADKCTSCKST